MSPDGTQNASRIEMDCTSTSSSDYSAIYQNLSLDGSSQYTISFYIKSNTSSEQDLLFFCNSSFSTQITANSEWQRVESTFTSNSTNPRNFGLVARGNIQQDVDILIWGAQLEQQSYATSYIPTEGSIKTRLADICNNSGSSDLINSTEGVLYAEISALSNTADSSKYITISDGTYNNRASILFSNGSTNQIRTFLRVGGVSQIDVSDNVTDVTDFNKVAFSYKENDFKVYINGSLVSSDTSGSVWSADTITKLSFSEINTSAGLFNGNVKTVAVFKEALSDEELQKLTQV
jgi:hypothetical protein